MGRAWDSPRMTREEIVYWERARDDADSIITMLYTALKFAVDVRMPVGNMKGLQDAIENVNAFRREVSSDLRHEKEKAGSK